MSVMLYASLAQVALGLAVMLVGVGYERSLFWLGLAVMAAGSVAYIANPLS